MSSEMTSRQARQLQSPTGEVAAEITAATPPLRPRPAPFFAPENLWTIEDRSKAECKQLTIWMQLSRLEKVDAGLRQDLSAVLAAVEAAESAEGTAARVAALRHRLSDSERAIAQTKGEIEHTAAYLRSLKPEVETQKFRLPAFYATLPPLPPVASRRQLDPGTQEKLERLSDKKTDPEWELFRMRCNEDELKWELEEAEVAVKAAKDAGREPEERITERVITRNFALGVVEGEIESMEEELKGTLMRIRSLL